MGAKKAEALATLVVTGAATALCLGVVLYSLGDPLLRHAFYGLMVGFFVALTIVMGVFFWNAWRTYQTFHR